MFSHRWLPSILVATLPLGISLGACSSDPAPAAAPVVQDAGRLEETPLTGLPAGCTGTISRPPLVASTHVDVGTEVLYNFNPPAWGNHYRDWASFSEYDRPIDRRYWVHSMEHGAVVFLYKCDGPCPETIETLRQAMASIPDDPDCKNAPGRKRVRAILTPDPQLDVPVAVSAWGWVYKASCADLPSLTAFAAAHYNQASEDFCDDGILPP